MLGQFKQSKPRKLEPLQKKTSITGKQTLVEKTRDMSMVQQNIHEEEAEEDEEGMHDNESKGAQMGGKNC